MYVANEKRYEIMKYNYSGKSGLKLPLVSLGLWHNFGQESSFQNAKEMILGSFDLGVTHFDIANVYGPPAGFAEEVFAKIFKDNLKPYRDELIISTKAGFHMGPGPYGEFGSRKHLMSNIDNSLKRLGLNYVDIYYQHRPDYETPLEETMTALSDIVKQGKALYIGLSNYYDHNYLDKALSILKSLKTPALIHQVKHSMLDRNVSGGVSDTTMKYGSGMICFSPLEQGILTDKYLKSIPNDSRVRSKSIFLNENNITNEVVAKVKKLNEIAKQRGQTMAQLALSWLLDKEYVTSVLVGASRLAQVKDNVEVAKAPPFTETELKEIESIISG